MISARWFTLELKKLFPLAISRGTSSGHSNFYLELSDGTHTGIGEASPGGHWSSATLTAGLDEFKAFVDGLDLERLSIFEIDRMAREAGVPAPFQASLDTALWDLTAKRAGMPLHRMLGLPVGRVATSVTAGLNPPELTRERVPLLLANGAKFLKVKLGSPEGYEFDQAHFSAAAEAAAPFGVGLRADANGGWSLETALKMVPWIASLGADYIEQPLVEGDEESLFALKEASPIPVFIDESCKTASDVAQYASRVDGINLKLMKTGGITEAMRLVAAARAHGLQTMIGCMGESSVAIGAGVAIAALFDHIDLDSHTNLNPDPATGLGWEDGVVTPPNAPGHGAGITG